MSPIPEEFHLFEHAGWERVPEPYDFAFGALTTQSASALLDAVEARHGIELLDVCTGPGYVAAEAARRGARVAAIDFSEAMIERASHAHPDIDFRAGDAQSLPFEDESFDAVVIAFGLLHLERPDDALREARRVLRPGGHVAAAVWCPPERTAGFRLVLEAVQAFGRKEVGLPPGPDFFRFGDPGESRRSFESAGFLRVRCREVPQTWHLAAADDLFLAMHEGTVRTAGLLAGQTTDDLHDIREHLKSTMRDFESASGFELPMPALLTHATVRHGG